MDTAPFISHPLIRGGQLQTLAGTIFPGEISLLRTRHEWVELGDGDSLLLSIEEPTLVPLARTLAESGTTGDDAGCVARRSDIPISSLLPPCHRRRQRHHTRQDLWLEGLSPDEEPHAGRAKPLVLLMHGLGGSGDSSYIRRQSAKLNQLGYTALRFNHRRCGPGSSTRARGIYHSGRTNDIAATVAFIAERWPERECILIGYSLSGNMLLRFLGQVPRANYPHVTRALAVCPPVDLEQCSRALSERRNRHIDQFFSLHMTRQARSREQGQPHAARVSVPFGMSLRGFDALYTAPLAGFASRDEYYALCSSRPVLPQIELPTQLLAASDDPIIPAESFNIDLPESVQVRLEKGGGHMGFICRDTTAYGDLRWLDSFVLDWVRSV